ncbi:MAG TPA: alkyl hydroperoxide reductase [Bacteroidales bacterium]|nr:alkyl hydroperoxide reductase [Bacteroidales bacterium]
MQKISLIALFAAVLLWSCNSEKSFTLTGTIEEAGKEMVYLTKAVDGVSTNIDSVALGEKGEFSFTGEIESPEVYSIKVGAERGVPVFMEAAKITFKAKFSDLANAEITGSKSADEFKALNDGLKPFYDKMNAMYQEYQAFAAVANQAGIDSISKAYDANDAEIKAYLVDYVKNNLKSHVSPYIVNRMLAYQLELSELEAYANGFDASLEGNVYVKALKDRVATLKAVAVGQAAPEITQLNPEGVNVSLSELKGKLVLIDFWASWCGPCRQENPNVVKLYNDYNAKGFEIFGVSLDESKEKWVEAIAKDSLVWKQVSDLKGWSSAAAKLYGVNSIPHTVLVGTDGKIIAHGLRGEELRAKVAEILK